MAVKLIIYLIFIIYQSSHLNGFKIDKQSDLIEPSLQIILIVHPFNKINELPFVLSGIEEQNYPKERINILVQTEIFYSVNTGEYDRSIEKFKNNDLTIRILKSWKKSIELEYHKFELKLNEIENDEDDLIDNYWTIDKYNKLMNFKQYAFDYALNQWVDYCLFQDADVILTNINTFKNILIDSISENDLEKNLQDNVEQNHTIENKAIISPMLLSLGLYSNWWAGINENGYYKRTDDYMPILERQKIGQFKVPMIYSFIFINLRIKKTRNLKFRYQDLNTDDKLQFDDIIVFAKSAKQLNLSTYIDNREIYGFIMPSIDKLDLNRQKQDLIDLQLECLVETNSVFNIVNNLEQFNYKNLDRLNSQINKFYVINLKRREERRIYMESACEILNLECDFVEAVDGKLIDKQYLIKNKINSMKGYLDPYHKRPLTFGEIGCFMSHYNTWLDIVKNNYSWSIVFEDDVRFERNFNLKLNELMESIEHNSEIDFIYLGRKREGKKEDERWFNNFTVYPTYSYWTIGYIISLNGAKKLIDNKPLEKLIPVDEYIPIIYDKHPNLEWKNQFKQRNLRALSMHPLLIQPLHYVGEDKYVSDTEDSIKLANEHIEL